MYGVYPHAVWHVTDHATGDGEPLETGGGFVVREVSCAVPYGRMRPIRTYKRRAAAEKLADRLTFGDER